ncbi:YihY/virulence factor BrkB family protein [Hyphococcus sp.]|uniref:YihY/virulence factor BrkB family protein n=1 Tax=Hyphococcus sp. TaxID=2038636 RepID=UPI003CCC1D2C
MTERWKIHFARLRELAPRIVRQINDDRIGLTAAGVAFYALLAIFPGLAAAVSVWGLIADPGEISAHLSEFRGVLPADVMTVLREQAYEVAAADEGVVSVTLIFSLAISFFSASRGVKAIMTALNIVYNEKESRGFLKFNFIAFLMTIAITIGFVVAIAAVAIVPIVFELVGLGGLLEPLIGLARWPILFAGAWLGIAALYRFAPSRSDDAWRWISPGAGAAVVLWIFASIAFSVYAQNFANYNETYGSIGAVIVMLMWFWVSAFVFLVGAEIDSEVLPDNTKDRGA